MPRDAARTAAPRPRSGRGRAGRRRPRSTASVRRARQRGRARANRPRRATRASHRRGDGCRRGRRTPTPRGRDDDVSGVRAAEHRERAGDAVRLVEDRRIAVQLDSGVRVTQDQLGAAASRDSTPVLPEEDDVRRPLPVEPLGEPASTRRGVARPVEVRRAIGRRHQRVLLMAERVADPRDVLHGGLPMVGHHDHRVPLEERVDPSGRLDETRPPASSQRRRTTSAASGPSACEA